MEKYEVNRKIEDFNKQIKDLTKKLNPDKLKEKLKSLNEKMQKDNFWQNQEQAKNVTKEANLINQRLAFLSELETNLSDISEWLLISEEHSEEWDILVDDIKSLDEKLDIFSTEILLSGPYDNNNAILEIHAGAGGTEAQDWADMLFRMYSRYINRNDFSLERVDLQQGDEAGIKSVTMLVKGSFAYGYLKAERGVHRLVRISPFDSNKRRHTSFASVEVMPEIEGELDIEIKDEDIRVDVYRASGAGGQHVNTTDSAVRITHLPTNIVVSCQSGRSQIKNRETAFNLLKTKLMQEEIRKQEELLKDIQGELKDIAWGSQIRSYVFHPYQMVKDHRTNYEVSQISDVMDGNINDFIREYLKMGGI